MRKPATIQALEELGRVRLSKHFFVRDFLYSDITNLHGVPNIPDDPDLAIAAGTRLCEELLEPLNATFGRIAIRSAYRSCQVNGFGSAQQKAGNGAYKCGSNEYNYSDHIWDRRDREGRMGATACIVVPWFADRYEQGADWRALAWWIHHHLPYSSMYFFPKLAAFNLQWREEPERRIDSYVNPRGNLTKPGMDNHAGSHAEWYEGFPEFKRQ
ncbi:MAG: hypothetical protein V2I51_21130 [Anderseniella sp.]|jgi:hypothetical protein|nr:hypothetical protein [Anderseniella sp.]